MSIQKRKAEELGLSFKAEFVNIMENEAMEDIEIDGISKYSPMLYCDE